ncbi:hypothetical protein [Paraburkholderia elongata]|uniref:Uncharacterized protein n=1 Tax=Paraburkholderia elongata TaxID=2675747 RepID=A0A972NKM4_9BURK|nr:hypothetical protein [Paraburkholderia elongata]NPT55101.1 hypothetical protein [Paraburkholderia elongata]
MWATKRVADSEHKLRYREDLAILPKNAARGKLPDGIALASERVRALGAVSHSATNRRMSAGFRMGLWHAATHSVERAVADDPAGEHAVRRDVARKVQIPAARIKFPQVNCA